MCTEPLTMTPVLEIAPKPPKNDRGTESTKAQGQDTTKNTRARVIQLAKSSFGSTNGTKASNTAQPTTIGV